RPSHRWADPRALLLDGQRWEAVREDVLAGLSLTDPAPAHLARQLITLDAAWKQTAARLGEAGDDARARVVPGPNGRARLVVDHLDALGDPGSLVWLRATAQTMMPRVDLPELLLEVHAWTGFLDAYTHLADVAARTKDLSVSVAALLVAEACNVGLTPVIKPGEPALSRARLAHVDQYYVRAENHAAASGVLIDAQAQIPIARAWGGGLLASVDGLRFVVPVRTINAGPSPKYFGYKRGITWLNAVNDQVAGIGQMVVPGTPRDSLFILDTLLNLDAGPRPEVVTTDNASYSDMVFGVFAILNYRFARRFANRYRPMSTCHPSSRRSVATARWSRSPATPSTSPRSPPSGQTCCAWPGRWSPARSAPTTCCACSAATDTPPRSGRPSPNTAGSPRPCTCSRSSTRSTAATSGG